MTHVRVLCENATNQPNDRISKRYDSIIKELDDLQKRFFNRDVERLHQIVADFFENEKDSPFPVVAHIMPPQDLTDALPFIEDLKKIPGVDFIDHQIHHIQSNRIILFHCTPPPADIPRVRIFEKCFEYKLLFEIFISEILCFCFRHGINPDPNIVGILKSILFDRYPSFTFLFTIIKQSLFEFISSKSDEELAEILDYSDFSQFSNIHTMETVPYSMLIMLRDDALKLTSNLMIQERLNPFLFSDASNYSKICTSDNFVQLKAKLNQRGDDYFLEMISEHGGRITMLPDLPNSTKKQGKSQPKTKSARMRMMAAATHSNDTELVQKYHALMSKLFVDLDEECPNYMPIIHVAAFNPRKALTSALADPNNKTDTAIAYQILQESDRSIGAAEWMRAFQAKADIEDKAIALSRFQVAVSELEYLGYTDQRSRRNGGFRHIIRV